MFEYDSYRTFLKDLYHSSKEKDPKFSFRFYSRMVGSKSPSFIKQVMDGDRNLTPKHVDALCRGLKFNVEESFYFRHLVLLNQAKTVEERQGHIEKILSSKAYRKVHPMSPEQYGFLARWFYVPLREIVGLPGFQEDPEWIAKRFVFPVSALEIKQALAEMLKLGLLRREPSGKLVQAEAHITTQDAIVSASLAKSHQELIRRGAESIDAVARDRRDILGVTFAVSAENMPKIKEKIMSFRREMVELLSAEKDPDSVYQFHLLLFPLAELSQNGKGK